MSSVQTSVSSLEMTKNPFDSDEERLNYPGFSPSMFVTQRTPVNQRKTKEFRWSIEQISRLYPADVDEFPNQEYSSTYERDEDERAAQEAIKEYFSQDAIVPSPWTPNRSAKKVTFSPLPPETQYIVKDCSFDSTYSQDTSINSKKLQFDASTQTLWSIPFDAVRLDEILGKAYETYEQTTDDSRNLSSSSLRRNLFPIDEQAHGKTDKNNNQTSSNTKMRSILKTSKSPVLATSSPLNGKHNNSKEKSPGTPYLDVSPIRISPLNKQCNHQDNPSNITSVHMSVNVLESSGIESELKMFPDISPIKDNAAVSENAWNEQSNLEDSKRMNVIDELDTAQDTGEVAPYNDSDDERPAKITMEDLAIDSDIDEYDDDHKNDDGGDYGDDNKPPSITMEDLSLPNDDAKPPSITIDDLSVLDVNKENQVDDVEAMETSIAKLPSLSGEHVVTLEDKLSDKYTSNNPTQHYHNELDEDIVMVKAAAALRRADQFAQRNSNNGHELTSKPSFPMSSMNTSQLPWQPVNMSTPLNATSRLRANASSFECDFDYDKYRIKSQEHNGYRNCSYYDTSGRRLSSVMEDVVRRQGVLKNTLKEVQSDSWMKPRSPLYQTSPLPGKWRTPRTYPLSKVEKKVLYGNPTAYRTPDFYMDPFSPQLYSDFMKYESKRTSWPPIRSSSLRSFNRPLSPTYWPLTHKVHSFYPEGSVSKTPIPARGYTIGNIQGGFDEWKKVISKNERSMRIQNIMSFY